MLQEQRLKELDFLEESEYDEEEEEDQQTV
jgi:hypothetical protein